MLRIARRRWRRYVVTLSLIGLAALYWVAQSYGTIATGFFAKSLCSGVFVAQRAAREVVDNDILPHSPRPLFARIQWTLDASQQRVSTQLPLGLGKAQARFRAGAGCALIDTELGLAPPVAANTQVATALATSVPTSRDATQAWPAGEAIARSTLSSPVQAKLQLALERGFAELDPAAPRRTRAIVVVHQGRIVAERYAAGFGPDVRMAGWSMAKSVTSAWVGALVEQKRLAIDEPVALTQWRGVTDSRAQISFRHLLNMVGGLDFSEQYASPFSDVNRMLFFSRDAAAYAAGQAPQAAPGAVFKYTSGTTNLISLALRERLGASYPNSPYQLLLNRIGMSSAVMETDAAGTFVGSSYLHATARDWARLGLLYLRDGVWNSQRILPEGWVAFSRQASPAGANYGAHWWLHEPSAVNDSRLPKDLFQATGFAGQRVSVMPSQDLVIVRLGLTLTSSALRHADLIDDVLNALR